MSLAEPVPAVLACVSFFPFPTNHGDAVRRLMLLEALTSVTDLTVVAVRREDTTDEDVESLRALLDGARVEVFSRDSRSQHRLLDLARRALRSITFGVPAWVISQHSTAAVRYVRDLDRQFDAAVIVGESSMPFATAAKARHLIWDKSNVLVWSSREALRTARGYRRIVEGWNHLFASIGERRAVGNCDAFWVTSDEERLRFEAAYSTAKPVSVLKSTVEAASRVVGAPATAHMVVGWLSSFGYSPNWDGLKEFVSLAAPSFVANGARLRVVGAGASEQQRQWLSQWPFVDFVGFADDLAAAFDGTSIAVVPVWHGAGVKLKTLSLMSLGIPVVASDVAMEGIPREAAYAVTSSPQEMVDVISHVDPANLSAAARRALAVLQSEFSREAFLARASELIGDKDSPVLASRRD
ncbi:glycosyltransferase [Microbacterium trichothecenolyticum]